uniref:Peptidoglycan bridge formation protein FemAB n=1 Tax=Thermosporothrix sp. COM3 TaxID=2490863 RepID=A0A455SM15_9CHLR|nr:peptidoglycan bridge formation protein FemAB [Thermosporothrix sp. COM3]
MQETRTEASFHPLVEQQLQESFFHDQAWLTLVARRYGYHTEILTTTDREGRITGMLPVSLVSSPLTGRRLVSFPFSDYCPVIAADISAERELVCQALDLARRSRVRYLELRPGTSLQGHDELMESDLYVRWMLELDSDLGTLWKRLRKPIQRQIKKARNQGVQVRPARERDEMALYYRLHLLTRNKHGMPAQPRAFFFDLWDAFASRGHLHLLLAEYQGTVIAGMILLAYGSTVRYAYGASSERFLQLAPNNLLLWEALSWGGTHGYRRFDFGRTARDNEGLMEFKRRWGAAMEPLPYYYFPEVAGMVATSESSAKYRVLTACWRRLPPAVAGPLGGYLYRHLG